LAPILPIYKGDKDWVISKWLYVILAISLIDLKD
jgi:hypothetical protein